MAAHPGAAPSVTIRPPRGWAPLDLRELLAGHELLYFLVLRNLKLRYKQTALGAAWAVLQPLLTMAVFTVVFGRLARLGSDGLPYQVFALAALVPWTYFSNALAQAAMKLGEALYKAQSAQAPGGDGPDAGAPGGKGGADDVVDADFTEVKDDDSKKSA